MIISKKWYLNIKNKNDKKNFFYFNNMFYDFFLWQKGDPVYEDPKKNTTKKIKSLNKAWWNIIKKNYSLKI